MDWALTLYPLKADALAAVPAPKKDHFFWKIIKLDQNKSIDERKSIRKLSNLNKNLAFSRTTSITNE